MWKGYVHLGFATGAVKATATIADTRVRTENFIFTYSSEKV
jgi:hypothetical protein